ncbi:MAG: tripartite tricarboxylate transporter substrate binding protein, partial [Burkholderiales bacterium]|nr:tripartite tricarboxylate transporter substrate binding protein [Burkholderiales bacterium]
MLRPERRRAMAGLAGMVAAGMLPAAARAQTARWPVGTIRFMAPVPPGGGVDVLSRRIADRLAAHLGVNVVVENRSGAGGMVGAQALAAAAADGSNLGYLHAGHLTLQAMGAKIDLTRDFVPVVGRYSASQFVIAVHVDAPYKTLADLIRAIQAQPGKLNYGSGGIGTPGHMTFETLRLRIPGLDAQYVPFKGAIDAVNALAAKNLDFVSGLLSAVLTQLRAGRLRALGVSGATRSPLLPDVPTIAEAGYPGFSLVSWGGIYAPPRLPDALTAQLRATLAKIAAEPEFKSFLEAQGSEPQPSETPEAFV